jgi:hypothetical protein
VVASSWRTPRTTTCSSSTTRRSRRPGEGRRDCGGARSRPGPRTAKLNGSLSAVATDEFPSTLDVKLRGTRSRTSRAGTSVPRRAWASSTRRDSRSAA